MKEQAIKEEIDLENEIEEKINQYLSKYTDSTEVKVLKNGKISFISCRESNEIHVIHLKNIIEIVEGRESIDYDDRFML